MRIAAHFGRIGIGDRPLDLDRLETSPRGLTGSDGTFIGLCRSMRDRGHDVRVFIHGAVHRTWEGMRVAPANMLGDSPEFDAVVSVNDADVFARVHPRAVRASNQQLADYAYCKKRFHESVDLFLPISEYQWDLLAKRTPGIDRVPYRVLPNGTDPSVYTDGVRIPGRCVYTSSPDRGLHNLCIAWPRIIERIPWARLRIFYHSLQKWFDETAGNLTHERAGYRENARRAQIVQQALVAHADTIEVVGSVSRQQMARELSEAECLTYPCEPLVPTETFCVSASEGCASGALPILTDADCLPEVFGEAAPMVKREKPDWLDEWTDLAIRAMTDRVWADSWRASGKAFAARHAWPVIAERLEGYLTEAVERKRVAA
jgi:glycosyltransferase involved in cell wall biosynthesis